MLLNKLKKSGKNQILILQKPKDHFFYLFYFIIHLIYHLLVFYGYC